MSYERDQLGEIRIEISELRQAVDNLTYYSRDQQEKLQDQLRILKRVDGYIGNAVAGLLFLIIGLLVVILWRVW